MNTETMLLPKTETESTRVECVAQQCLVKKPRKPVAREIIIARSKKASATKLAKRITITCAACGKEWKEKPSHFWRRYCSTKCAGNTVKNPDSKKTCVNCGGQFYTTWRTRKQITCSLSCAYKWRGKLFKKNGHSWIKYRNESKWLESVQSEENRKKISAINLGKVCSTPKTKRYSPQHARAVECFLRSPSNVVYYVRNITRFVHENHKLFPPQTLNWKPHNKYKASLSCAATSCLAAVASGRRMSWRGWQVISNREGREQNDLIGRNYQVPVPTNS